MVGINVTQVLERYFDILERHGYFPIKPTINIIAMLYVDKLTSDPRYSLESECIKTKVDGLINCLKKHCLV